MSGLRRIFLVAGLVLLTGMLAGVRGDDSDRKPVNNKASSDKAVGNQAAKKEDKPAKAAAAKANLKNADANSELAADREAAALAFAQQHHPELVSLIEPLKTSSPKDYQKAIRELFRVSERLRQIHERQPGRYDLELETWKIGSQIRLLLAQWAMVPSEQIEQDLKAALRKQRQIRLELAQYERQELRERLQKLDQQIANFEKQSDQVIDQEYKGLLRKLRQESPAAVRTAKPLNKPKADKLPAKN